MKIKYHYINQFICVSSLVQSNANKGVCPNSIIVIQLPKRLFRCDGVTLALNFKSNVTTYFRWSKATREKTFVNRPIFPI